MGRGYTWPAEALVAAAQRGDEASIAALVSGAHPHVRRFAFTLCASDQDAEDAAQEAMIVLFRKIGTLRAATALASWMFRIVRNECLRRARAVLATPPTEDLPTASAEDDVLDRLERERVAAAIAALPHDQRRVLIMRDVQGLSGGEVARALGLSVPAMKSRLHRARAAVRDHLG
ncbi:RNA polymerase sigma factor [Saccharothrix variisporea]|uniref:RNA polymerase sigma factor (Sigma-70 family) n=1 Tax=Saccharothrix variisporea TaxID=543527 RepID=A0A495X7Y0_9PSEU|nr:sigma-70 family RNA polymerase sigma factor [Saccharothrix variisporea]RKT67638.1 RNA polymerase sigma factor (sigma-70 family) [Saccharothrix variisporea]